MTRPRVVFSRDSALTFLSWLSIPFVIAFACWAYFPGFGGPVLLDDRGNIPLLESDTLKAQEAMEIVLGNRSGPLGRPISMITFVGEALLWDSGPTTGKAVNMGLHAANTLLVYLLILMILRGFECSTPWVAAFTAAMIWCWAPLQLSTVLYHVQRMTLLSSFFMLLTLHSALRWRACLERYSRTHFAWGFATTVLALLAIFSKENAATLVLIVPGMLALYPSATGGERGVALQRVFARVFLVLSIAIVCVLIYQWSWITSGYDIRDYTVAERALSQPRILIDYVRQFFWPQSTRMGLVHDDFRLSRGLFSPITTFLSLLFFTALIALGLILRASALGKQLLMCVAIFLLGHALESTVLALEPYFEHRNYFPSIGLVLAVAFVLSACLRRAPAITLPLFVWLLIYSGSLLVETGAQAMVWSKAELIVLHDVNGHPESPRANRAMALLLAQSHDLELALAYSDKAYPNIEGGPGLDRFVFAFALSCVSRQPLSDRDVSAVRQFSGLRDRTAREAMQLVINGIYDSGCDRSRVLALADRLEELAKLTPVNSELVPLLSTVAVLENALERYPVALWYTEQALSMVPNDIQLLLMNLHFCVAVQGAEACSDRMQHLGTLQQRGLLSRDQSETLALYAIGD